ncbi:prolyl-tRNA synthetase associated domain-containing protein [Aeromonas sp. L_1B5_3]|uniref:prolyl-tRNA synthetase associated domain-containing protein n=1 Tax=Aeromonas sp. L_1B5_3 TaxID=1588629 RepID=UPI0018CEED6F|nr:prolyl-tRNA synthetase associated domain-containing protein [Aeromonas sp. L_1B5_3]
MVALYSLLDQLAIPYQRIDHAPVFTCEEASRLLPDLPAAKSKNLFLRDPKSERLFLVVTQEESRVDLKALAAAFGVKRLSFGSPERLEAVLGLTPGSVTLLAMVRDRENAVELVVDEAIWQAEQVQCHPLVNTATLIIRLDDVRRLLSHLGREANVMRLPVVAAD